MLRDTVLGSTGQQHTRAMAVHRETGPHRSRVLRAKSRAGEFAASRGMNKETLNSCEEMHQERRSGAWALESLSKGQGCFQCSISEGCLHSFYCRLDPRLRASHMLLIPSPGFPHIQHHHSPLKVRTLKFRLVGDWTNVRQMVSSGARMKDQVSRLAPRPAVILISDGFGKTWLLLPPPFQPQQ